MLGRFSREAAFIYRSKDICKYISLPYLCKRKCYEDSKVVSKGGPVSPEANDFDVFGTLKKPKDSFEYFTENEKDQKEEKGIELENYYQQIKNNIQYTKQVKKLLKKRKLSEALSILDRGYLTKPDAYIYGLLIRACGHVGYTKKAFMLFNQMKKRGITPRASVYTSLFNACSQSPWKEDGLSRASKLLESLEDRGYEPNDINYNAMIKAFGRCGDISRAFSLVDQMVSRGIKPDASTFAFLLQSCASDLNAGFRHAVLVWNKMLSKGVQPTLYTYNLMLRCCRDCDTGKGIDSGILTTWRLNRIPMSNRFDSSSDNIPILLTEPEKCREININDAIERIESAIPNEKSVSNSIEIVDIDNSDNINTRKIELVEGGPPSNAITVKPLSPEERLQCLGGCEGFLRHMAIDSIKPDIKTFTQLLEVIPPNEDAEKSLMTSLKNKGLKEDIEFYNMLIKKRTMRFDYDGARSVLQLMSSSGLDPNVMTFGILALGCQSKEEVANYLTQVKNAGFRLNAEMVGALIRGTCHRWDVYGVLELMELCITENVRPNAQLIGHLKKFRSKIEKKMILKGNHQKMQEDQKRQENHQKDSYSKALNVYRMRLASWMKEIDLSEADDHPWKQFRRHHQLDGAELSSTLNN